MDLAFTHAGAPGISLWRNVEGKKLERVKLPDFGWQRGWGISAIDYDNDGWVDLIAAGESVCRRRSSTAPESRRPGLGRRHQGNSISTQSNSTNLAHWPSPTPAAIGQADIVVTQLGGPPVILHSEGSAAHNWMHIDLKSLSDNKTGIGTKVEIYAGPLYQKWEVAGASGYLGQNSTSVLAGLGAEKNVEVVRLLWPTGVPQDEINLAAKKSHHSLNSTAAAAPARCSSPGTATNTNSSPT